MTVPWLRRMPSWRLDASMGGVVFAALFALHVGAAAVEPPFERWCERVRLGDWDSSREVRGSASGTSSRSWQNQTGVWTVETELTRERGRATISSTSGLCGVLTDRRWAVHEVYAAADGAILAVVPWRSPHSGRLGQATIRLGAENELLGIVFSNDYKMGEWLAWRGSPSEIQLDVVHHARLPQPAPRWQRWLGLGYYSSGTFRRVLARFCYRDGYFHLDPQVPLTSAVEFWIATPEDRVRFTPEQPMEDAIESVHSRIVQLSPEGPP